MNQQYYFTIPPNRLVYTYICMNGVAVRSLSQIVLSDDGGVSRYVIMVEEHFFLSQMMSEDL